MRSINMHRWNPGPVRLPKSGGRVLEKHSGLDLLQALPAFQFARRLGRRFFFVSPPQHFPSCSHFFLGSLPPAPLHSYLHQSVFVAFDWLSSSPFCTPYFLTLTPRHCPVTAAHISLFLPPQFPSPVGQNKVGIRNHKSLLSLNSPLGRTVCYF